MKTKTNTNTHQTTTTQTAPQAECIKLGIDVHADSYQVVRQLDDATPQPAQKFTPNDFLRWTKKQLTQAGEVHSCYEAGPLGYSLHRAPEALGIHNLVIRPRNWDELGRGVKTDQTDALALVQRLDRYVQGNRHALAVVRVPTATRTGPGPKPAARAIAGAPSAFGSPGPELPALPWDPDQGALVAGARLGHAPEPGDGAAAQTVDRDP